MAENKRGKSVTLRKEVWRKLVKLKLEMDFRSYSDLLEYLFSKSEKFLKKGGVE